MCRKAALVVLLSFHIVEKVNKHINYVLTCTVSGTVGPNLPFYVCFALVGANIYISLTPLHLSDTYSQ